MASKKELIHAQKFNRRRLLTAFVSGAPGGRELEPSKPLRGVVLGAILAVLVAVGGLIAGSFTGTLPQDWQDGSIVVVKGEGTRYVALDGTLYPVANLASARLIAGTAGVLEVDAQQLDGIPRDPQTRGISGAPDSLPAADRLVTGAWTACPQPGRVDTRIWTSGVPAAADVAAIVTTADERFFYVADGARYEIAAEDAPSMAVAVQLDADPATVGASWLNLLEQGSALEPVTLDGAGDAAGGAAGGLDLRIGQLVRTVDTEQNVTGQYVVSDASRLAPVDDFAREIYQGFVEDRTLVTEPATLSAAEAGALVDDSAGLFPGDWPDRVAPPADSSACVRIAPTADGAEVSMSEAPSELETGVSIEPGRAVLAALSTSGGGNAWALVAEDGTLFPITTAEDVEILGYDPAEAVDVPSAWAALFQQGPELSRTAALGGS